MTAVTRRVLDMCVRILSWLVSYPDDEPGSATLAERLRALVTRIDQAIATQRNGLSDVQTASLRKRELMREMLAVPIAHLAEIGKLASREVHELGRAFRVGDAKGTLVGFYSAAREMLSQARLHEEVLVRYGLSHSVLVDFGRMLDEFDAATKLGIEARTAHKAATQELEALTVEAGRIVRGMDARNRVRFRDDRQALEQWIAARKVLGSPRESDGESGQPAAEGGDVRPAA
jgi:hypothetical protein